jgi:hypothetical protein
MPIITNQQTPTADDRKAAAKQSIHSTINSLYSAMIVAYRRCMDTVWKHPTLAPQEILDAFGTDAGELFRLAGILKNAINAATPNTIPDSTVDVTVNSDGTVTINPPAPTP